MSLEEAMQENEELRTENADLQRQLAEATDYIEFYEDQFR